MIACYNYLTKTPLIEKLASPDIKNHALLSVILVVGRTGIEPVTPRLKAWRSTTELTAQKNNTKFTTG